MKQLSLKKLGEFAFGLVFLAFTVWVIARAWKAGTAGGGLFRSFRGSGDESGYGIGYADYRMRKNNHNARHITRGRGSTRPYMKG